MEPSTNPSRAPRAQPGWVPAISIDRAARALGVGRLPVGGIGRRCLLSAQGRHKGRLIDHIGMVVRDFPASRGFYTAVLEALRVPIAGSDDQNLWADELFIGSRASDEGQGELTGRRHIAFQALDPDGNNLEAVFRGGAMRDR